MTPKQEEAYRALISLFEDEEMDRIAHLTSLRIQLEARRTVRLCQT